MKYFSKAGHLIVFAKHIDSSIRTDSSASVRMSLKATGYSANDGYVTAVCTTFAYAYRP